MLQIWSFGPFLPKNDILGVEILKTKAIALFIFTDYCWCWVVSCGFINFWLASGSFWLVSGSFRLVSGGFVLVSGGSVLISGGFRSFQVVSDGFRSFQVVSGRSVF